MPLDKCVFYEEKKDLDQKNYLRGFKMKEKSSTTSLPFFPFLVKQEERSVCDEVCDEVCVGVCVRVSSR